MSDISVYLMIRSVFWGDFSVTLFPFIIDFIYNCALIFLNYYYVNGKVNKKKSLRLKRLLALYKII